MTKVYESPTDREPSDQQLAGIPVRSRRMFTAWPGARKITLSIVVSLASFLILGTLSALWPNPFFIRMTPVTGFEPAFLGAQSILLGVFVAIRRPRCKLRTVGVSSMVNFLGIACPVCNKVLMFVFGASALLTYFEPIRVYVALFGVLLGLAAVLMEMRKRSSAFRMEANPFGVQT